MAARPPTWALCLSLLLGSCSACSTDSPANKCERAEGLIREAYTSACEGKADTCCFCRCWSDGQREYDQEQYRADGTCECLEAKGNRACRCEGERLAVAEKCLDDPGACRARAAHFVTAESGLCTLTPMD